MIVRFSSEDVEEIVYDQNSFNYETRDSGIIYSNLNFKYKEISADFAEIQFDNLALRYGKGIATTPFRLDFEDATEVVEMHFNLSGSTRTRIKELNLDYTIKSNEHNLFYCKEIEGHLNWLSKDMEMLEIHLSPKLLKKYIPKGNVFDLFLESMMNKEFAYFDKRNFPITPQMLIVINEIRNCPLVGNLKKLFIESKVMELLLLQITQIQELSEEKSHKISLDFDQMVFAKEIILSRIENPLSLNELAKEIGTNECSLKKNFKQAFGTTVFGFVNEVKMEKAKYLLQNKQRTIKEVSELIGYKNPQHFSSAFKKKYGIQPSMLR